MDREILNAFSSLQERIIKLEVCFKNKTMTADSVRKHLKTAKWLIEEFSKELKDKTIANDLAELADLVLEETEMPMPYSR